MARSTLLPTRLPEATPAVDVTHVGWWSDWNTIFVAIALVLTMWVVTAATQGRRRRFITPTALTLITAILTTNAITGWVPDGRALEVRAHRIFHPTVTSEETLRAGTDTTGAVVRTAIPGGRDAGLRSDEAFVYLPPKYDPKQRYPVVYLVHGSPGAAPDWFAAGQAPTTLDHLISAGEAPPVIAVAPTLAGAEQSDTSCLDATNGAALQAETYVLDTVVKWTDKTYPTIPTPTGRVLAGMSMGGFCALNIGLVAPDVYGAMIAIQPLATPGDAARYWLHVSDIDDHNILNVIAQRGGADGQSVWLGTGSLVPGQELDTMRKIHEALQERGFASNMALASPHGHTWSAARVLLPDALRWALHRLQVNPPAPSVGEVPPLPES